MTARDRRGAWLQLAAGVAGVVITALPVDHDHVGRRETRVFRAVNDLPDELFGPLWLVMQLGTVGAAPAVAAAAHAAGDDELARRVLFTGPATWALSKAVKRRVRRGRPGSLLRRVHTRGREASGLGYLSGHAGVAAVLGLAVLHHRGYHRAGRVAALVLMPVVGLTRIYVGAHLPLDVAGGAALGVAVDALADLMRPDS